MPTKSAKNTGEAGISRFQWAGTAKDRFPGVGDLPGELRGLAREILKTKPEDVADDAAGTPSEERRDVATRVGELLLEEREQLITVFFPNLTTEIVEAWDFIATVPPREMSGGTKCFRFAADHPRVRSAQANWFIEMVGIAGTYQPEVITPEWLAVWAPLIDSQEMASFAAMFGMNLDGVRRQDTVGRFMAAVISSGGKSAENVLDTLKLIAEGRHPTAKFGGQVTRGLLLANREAANDVLLGVLESSDDGGLCGTIVNAAGEASLAVFAEVLGTVARRQLLKMDGVLKSLSDLFDFDLSKLGDWKAELHELIEMTCAFLTDESRRQLEYQSPSAESAFFALWASGVINVNEMISQGLELLKNEDESVRQSAARALGMVGNPDAFNAWIKVLGDQDLDVALWGIRWAEAENPPANTANHMQVHTRLDQLIQRIEKAKHKLAQKHSEEHIKELYSEAKELRALYSAGTPLETLYRDADTYDGLQAFHKGVDACTAKTPAERTAIFVLIADAVKDWNGHSHALKLIEVFGRDGLEPSELGRLDKMLLASDESTLFRRSHEILAKMPEPQLRPLVELHLFSKKQDERRSGLEFLRQLVLKKQSLPWVRAMSERYLEKLKIPTSKEKAAFEVVRDAVASVQLEPLPTATTNEESPKKGKKKTKKATVEAGELGAATADASANLVSSVLQGSGALTWPLTPVEPLQPTEVITMTPAVMKLGQLIKDLDSQERDRNEILDAINNRPDDCRDNDGLELARVNWWIGPAVDREYLTWISRSVARRGLLRLAEPAKSLNINNVFNATNALMVASTECSRDKQNFEIDVLQATCSAIPPEDITPETIGQWRMPYGRGYRTPALMLARLAHSVESFDDHQFERYWKLSVWLDRPAANVPRQRPRYEHVLRAFDLGIASDGEVVDAVLHHQLSLDSNSAERLVGKHISRRQADFQRIIRAIVADLVAEECQRTSDLVGLTTGKAHRIESIVGVDYLLAFLEQLDPRGFVPASNLDRVKLTRAGTRSHFIRVTLPDSVGSGAAPQGKSPPGIHKPSQAALEEFAQRIAPLRKGQLTAGRLLELAFHAPQWAWYVEHTLGWAGIAETVLWCHTHLLTDGLDRALHGDGYFATASTEITTADEFDRWYETQDRALDLMLLAFTGHKTTVKKGKWDDDKRQFPKERSLAWINKIRSRLDDAQWQQLTSAMKAAGAPGEINKLLLEIGAGGKSPKVKLPDLKKVLEDVEIKHRKAAVDKLTKIPLATGPQRNADLAERVRVLSAYRRFYAPKALGMYGESAQDSLGVADQAFEELAKLAGLQDERQLHWLIGNSLPDRINALGAGGRVTLGQTAITLRVDETGAATVEVKQNGKSLKSIPPELKQNPKIKDLLVLRDEIKLLAESARGFMQHTMLAGTTMTPAEWLTYQANPILKNLCASLVFIVESQGSGQSKSALLGYLTLDEPCHLTNHRGKTHKLAPDTSLRVAHPVDFYATGEWLAWKSAVVEQQRVEPFKQVTRQLFVPTAEEVARTASAAQESPRSFYNDDILVQDGQKYGVLRFADTPIKGNQAEALLHKQAWVTLFSDVYQRAFGSYWVTAHLKYVANADSEDFQTVVSSVVFYNIDETTNDTRLVALGDVPPRIFSEALREINMAVTVASEKLDSANESTGAQASKAKSKSKSKSQSKNVADRKQPPGEEIISLRLQLLNELVAERRLKNVTISGTSVKVVGQLDTYIVNLVTGEAKRQSGKMFFTESATVSAAHDSFESIDTETPGTTRVVSLILHLAEDHKIKEPSLIDQLRS